MLEIPILLMQFATKYLLFNQFVLITVGNNYEYFNKQMYSAIALSEN